MKERVFGLDLMRFVAIMLVIIGHGTSLMPSSPEISRAISYIDFLGVEIFFVLSGYLIGSILINLFEKEDVDFSVIKGFWARRWWRTMPNYFLFLLINYVGFVLLKPDFVFDWRFLFFLQNLYYLPERFFSVSWSLTVEEWFYFAIPLVVWGVYKVTFDVRRSFLISVIFVVIAITLYRFFYIAVNDPQWNEELRRVVILRLDSLLYGVAGAAVRFYFPAVFNQLKYHGLYLGGLCLVIAVLLRFDASLNDSVLKRAILFPVISFGFLLFLPWLNSLKWVTGGIVKKFVTNVSIWSYSLYLIHVPLMDALSYILKHYTGGGVIFEIFIFLVWLGAALFLSMLNYIYFEKPLTNVRDVKWQAFIFRRAT